MRMKPINNYRLYEVLHGFCRKLYGSSKKQMVSRLLSERILPASRKFLEPIWIEMEENHKEIEILHKTDKGLD